MSEFQEIELSYGHGRLTCWVRNAPKICRKTKTDPKGRTRLKCQEKETTIGPLEGIAYKIFGRRSLKLSKSKKLMFLGIDGSMKMQEFHKFQETSVYGGQMLSF